MMARTGPSTASITTSSGVICAAGRALEHVGEAGGARPDAGHAVARPPAPACRPVPLLVCAVLLLHARFRALTRLGACHTGKPRRDESRRHSAAPGLFGRPRGDHPGADDDADRDQGEGDAEPGSRGRQRRRRRPVDRGQGLREGRGARRGLAAAEEERAACERKKIWIAVEEAAATATPSMVIDARSGARRRRVPRRRA